MKLVGLDEQMDQLLQERRMISTQVKDEDLTIHREKKFCLICKGDVSGYIYTCECDTLYCDKCIQALIKIENAYWVCNRPIDISKPSKPFKEEKLKEKEIIKKQHNYKNY